MIIDISLFAEQLRRFSFQTQDQTAWNEWLASRYYDAFLDAVSCLRTDVLFDSHLHGIDHILRVMIWGSFLARLDHLEQADLDLLLSACSYHDVGRIDDRRDDEHGMRSAARLAELTAAEGDDLHLLQAMTEAHARPDLLMDQVALKYGAKPYDRFIRLTHLLKDADGLDRVRIHALDPTYLRRPFSADYIALAYALFDQLRKDTLMSCCISAGSSGTDLGSRDSTADRSDLVPGRPGAAPSGRPSGQRSD